MSSMQKFVFGCYEIRTYINPAQELPEDDFWPLYQSLLDTNAERPQPIEHRLLCPIDDNREFISKTYSQMVLTVAFVNGQAIGFLISPIVTSEKVWFVHSGLVVIAYNPGVDILGLLSLVMVTMVYKRFGKSYFTNISSTPSIIEAFGQTMKPKKTWPDPHANLVKSPWYYRKILEVLFNEYVLNYFPQPEKVILDRRRFSLHSESQAMGFNTDFRSLSRSVDFKYLNFCFTWLDYEKEEDLVQVGLFTWREALRARVFILLAKFSLRNKKVTLPLEKSSERKTKVDYPDAV